MIRKFAAAAVVAAIISLGAGIPADAGRPQPDPTSYTEMAQFYRCGEYQRGPHVRGWLVRSRWGYVHVTSEPFFPVATCSR